MLWPKNIHTRNLTTAKKIPAARKFPSPPITFLMVRPLVEQFSKRKNYCKNIFITTMCNVYQSK